VLGFGGLAAGLIMGTAAEAASRGMGAMLGSGGSKGPMALNQANAERLAHTLCRMRGAALKIGQMLSIQDDSLLPPEVKGVFERVREGADILPAYQLHGVLVGEFGPEWRSLMAEFEDTPAASASIGQVHRATLHDGRHVMVKVQYPGVADSVQSDLNNLKMLTQYTGVVPRGLYIDNIMRVAGRELEAECDYIAEAEHTTRFKKLAEEFNEFHGTAPAVQVPNIIPELSSQRVVTTELAAGHPVDYARELSEEQRDLIGTQLLRLAIEELFFWRFMQTDPNWSNVLYDDESHNMTLIDFGACREYSAEFRDAYVEMIHACSTRNRAQAVTSSIEMGFLTGDEGDAMLNAHVDAAMLIGEPFATPGPFDFRSQDITQEVKDLTTIMIKHRQTPPPDEVYSLHRKLAGTFQTCVHLGARVDCHRVFNEAYERHHRNRQRS